MLLLFLAAAWQYAARYLPNFVAAPKRSFTRLG